ncbi:MAG: efflux RND transporter periplasmic adaptor subunit [Chloroflexi bacterium]|nr:efflux RND transporter periplasmic adaptor subunit [Chloroflexota bacterium]MBP7041218.1 efflux RND transporter periplasmic adaptor subunit [Chloroflexota bacterium]
MDNKKKRRRQIGIIGAVVVVMIVGGFLFFRSRANQTAVDTSAPEIVTAVIGDLSATATASGNVITSREAALSVEMPGRVQQVNVRIGDVVQAGDVLMQLDATDLALNVAVAEQNLKLKQASLADLTADPTSAEVAAAETAVLSAQAQLDDILSGPSAEEIAAQQANLTAAEANVWSSSAQLAQAQNAIKPADIAAAEASLAAAEANLRSVEMQYTRNPDPDNTAANTALAQAREQVAAAQAALDTLKAGPDANQLGSAQAGLSAVVAQRDASAANLDKLTADPTNSALAGAQAQVAQAQASLDALLRGATEEQIAAAEAEVAQAEINLADAQASLAGMSVTAPFDGVVTAVNYNEGEFASGPVIELVDIASLEVVLEVDEIDVGRLQVGQPTRITLETWPQQAIDGEVASIAPGATIDPGSSLVLYEVHVKLGATDLPVLVGMTANANLITDEKSGILLVPNQAINVDRTSGKYSVNLLLADGTTQEVPITIGLRDGRNTEVTSGLNAGDQLVVGNAAPRLDLLSGPPQN